MQSTILVCEAKIPGQIHINPQSTTTRLFQGQRIFLIRLPQNACVLLLFANSRQTRGPIMSVQPNLLCSLTKAMAVCQQTLEISRDHHSSPKHRFPGDSDYSLGHVPFGLQNPNHFEGQSQKGSKTSSSACKEQPPPPAAKRTV